jgi:hypothetical protein
VEVFHAVSAAGEAPVGPAYAEHHVESYLVGPAEESDPARWRTEVVVPYRES